jgi:hypothetical protein
MCALPRWVKPATVIPLLLNDLDICTLPLKTSSIFILDAPPPLSHSRRQPFSSDLRLHLRLLLLLLLCCALLAHDYYLAPSFLSFHPNPYLFPHAGRLRCPYPCSLALPHHLPHLALMTTPHENNPQTRHRVLLHAVIGTDLGRVMLAICPHKPYSRVAPPLLRVEGY